MSRFMFLLRLLMLIKFAFAAKFFKTYEKETGLNDNGQAIFFWIKSPGIINCVAQCLQKEGCLAVVHQIDTETCFFLNSTDTLVDSNDNGISYVYVGDHCLEGWIEFNGSCYFFGNQVFTWSGALDFCDMQDSALVEIETLNENVFIQTILSNIEQETHWIGLTDQALEGTWVWASGAAATFIDWGANQPNNGIVSNCAGIWASFGNRWVDEPCANLFYPICERATTSAP